MNKQEIGRKTGRRSDDRRLGETSMAKSEALLVLGAICSFGDSTRTKDLVIGSCPGSRRKLPGH